MRTTRITRDAWRVAIIGDLDRLTTAGFTTHHATLIDPPVHAPTHVEVDLSQLTRCDTAGLAALDAAIAAIEASGVQVTVIGANRQVRNLLRLAAQRGWLTAGPLLAASQPNRDTPPAQPHLSPRSVRTVR